jgi:hypothetical protein
MLDLSRSYLVPFDPYDTGEAFGFMRATVSGRTEWWLTQVWADDDADETVMVRFLNPAGPGSLEVTARAAQYAGRPWYPIPWISDDVPRGHAPAYRLTLDAPRGVRITHEWGPGDLGEDGRASVRATLEEALGGPVDA